MNNTEKIFSKISENEVLMGFCNKIMGYNNILNFEESRNIFFESLSLKHISGKDDAIDAMKTIHFVDKYLNLMEFDTPELKDEIEVKLDDMMMKISIYLDSLL